MSISSSVVVCVFVSLSGWGQNNEVAGFACPAYKLIGQRRFSSSCSTDRSADLEPLATNETSGKPPRVSLSNGERSPVPDTSLTDAEPALSPTRNNPTTAALDDGSAYEVPSVQAILKFAVPAIGVWLCSPLLSMIDTSAVGVLAGTAQQAALNPAVAVTDYSVRCMSFLYTGATSILARQQASDDEQLAKTFLGGLQLSVLAGTCLAATLLMAGPAMLRALIGNDAIDPVVFGSALKYVRIRALGMPAAAVIGTAQASCLGLKDVTSPLKAIGTAAMVNLVLDLLFVGQRQAWLGGAAGAAWATILSQYFAVTLFLRALGSKASARTSPARGKESQSTSTRGILSSFRLKQLQTWAQWPSKGIWSRFRPFFLPVTTTQVGRCSAYIAMGHVVSSCLGTNRILAANQIVTALLYTLIPISDSLGLTAQSFLPSLLAKPDSPQKARALRQTTLSFLKAALLFGASLSALVAALPLFFNIFTTDVAVQGLVQNVLPVLGICFALHGVFCGSEGILLAHRDLKFLGRMYGVFFAVVPAVFLRMKQLTLSGKANIGLATVWQTFLCYHLIRMACWAGRVLQLQRRCYRRGRQAPAPALA